MLLLWIMLAVFGYIVVAGIMHGVATRVIQVDDDVDAMLIAVFWPIFWGCYLPFKFGEYISTIPRTIKHRIAENKKRVVIKEPERDSYLEEAVAELETELKGK